MKGAIASLVPSVPTAGVIEATSLSALESLALDVPVIASDIGGLSEIDNGSGVMSLVPSGDKGAIKDQLEAWYRRRSEERGIFRSEYIRAHFGVHQWLDRHLSIYEEMLTPVRANHVRPIAVY
jgi:glycosyltransferase involved in cell wall biosynthesis